MDFQNKHTQVKLSNPKNALLVPQELHSVSLASFVFPTVSTLSQVSKITCFYNLGQVEEENQIACILLGPGFFFFQC